MSEPIDFWFTVGSTYTYLTVMRLHDVSRATGVAFRWRPFRLLTILQEMKHVPFADKPAKAAYMWRDIERRARMYGLPWAGPPGYPLADSALPNRIAILAAQEGWCSDYVRAAYERWFLHRENADEIQNVRLSLQSIGQDVERVRRLAESDEVQAALSHATDTARALGIFGAPTFATHGEIFWGDDRLDDAVKWHLRGTLAPKP
jgi:2-hydroxychromene-2-carboxylate isomerase